MTTDHYPEVSVSARECWSNSRQQSGSSPTKSDSPAPPQYTTIPPPSNLSAQQKHTRSDSVHNDSDDETEIMLHVLEEEYARYTDASPPYSETQYEGKSEDEQTSMRMRDYAKELSRMMGRQLIKGMRNETSGKTESE